MEQKRMTQENIAELSTGGFEMERNWKELTANKEQKKVNWQKLVPAILNFYFAFT